MDKQNILRDRIQDITKQCMIRNRAEFLGFLNEAEIAQAENILGEICYYNFSFWGGFKGAQRKVLGVFPSYQQPSIDYFDVIALFFRIKSFENLTHRDFLGSVLSLGLERSAVGDIVVQGDKVVILTKGSLKAFISSSLKKVSHSKLEFMQGYHEEINVNLEFRKAYSTVASGRLDCVLGAILRKSREKSCELLNSSLVKVNYDEISMRTYKVKNGDIISVKGYGKFKITSIENKTRKNRLKLEFEKFI